MGDKMTHGIILRTSVPKDQAAGLRTYLEGALKRNPVLRRASYAYRVRLDLDSGYLGIEIKDPKLGAEIRQQYESFLRGQGFRAEDIEEYHPEKKEDKRPSRREPEHRAPAGRAHYRAEGPSEFTKYLVSRIVVGNYQGLSGIRRNFSNSFGRQVDTVDVVVRESGANSDSWTSLSFQELVPGSKGRKRRDKFFEVWPSSTESAEVVVGELAKAPRNFDVQLVNDYRQPRHGTLGHALTATLVRTVEKEHSIRYRPEPLDQTLREALGEAMARNEDWKSDGIEVNPARVFILPHSI